MKPQSRITQSLISDVVENLRAGKNVQMELPSGGSLHLDRMVPFLCLSRTTSPGLERFVRSEAAYVVAPPRRFYQKGFTQLVRAIAEECASQLGSFLIIELWENDKPAPPHPITGSVKPGFKIVARRKHMPSDSIAALRNGLSRIRVQRVQADVEILYRDSPKPAGAPVLIPHADLMRLNCFWIGVEVSPVYRHHDTGALYPHLHRIIHRGVTRAIKQSVFTFCHAQTSARPKTPLVLGPHGVPRKVWKVDQRLAAIAKQIDFLLLTTPVNAKQAWPEFRKNGFRSKPRFFYRPIPFDVALLKRDLYRIPIDELDDPVWTNLFQQKRRELDTQLSMLDDRNTANFFHGSMQLFGGVSQELLANAHYLLKTLPVRGSAETGDPLEQNVLKKAAEEMIRSYQTRNTDFSPSVVVRDDVTGLIVSGDTLYIGELRAIPDHRIVPLLTHEVGTHLLTYYNACKQPLNLLQCGLPGYDELQEGLAVLSEYLAGGLSAPRMRLLAGRVVGVHMLMSGARFEETYGVLKHEYRFDPRTAFVITMRIYRSGGLTKDAVYLRGLIQLLEHLRQNSGFELLLAGKFNFSHVPIIQELTARNVLNPPTLLPHYLLTEEGVERLRRVRNGMNVQELIGSNHS